MARLNIERQNQLEPKRMAYAKREIEKFGYTVKQLGNVRLEFEFRGHTVRFFPYSGWASGASIIDGRGLKNLLKQLTHSINS